ncbi:MAG: hypothetical protein N3G21_04790 [Candidatus Hydrogenedentes bacterium]|nr:hypothetical protein [Candidatus Hydrogenedentota bacterium]
MKIRISDTPQLRNLSSQDFYFPIFSEIGAGNFGLWKKDEEGLPCYELKKEVLISKDVWHLVGNERIKATAHSGGYVQVYSWDTGPQVLNYFDPEKGFFSGGYSVIVSKDKQYITLFKLCSEGVEFSLTFGCGYAKKILSFASELHIEEVVEAPRGKYPLLNHKIKVENISSEEKTFLLLPVWQPNWYPLDPALIMTSPFDKFWKFLRCVRSNRINSKYELKVLSNRISLECITKRDFQKSTWKVIPVHEIYYCAKGDFKPIRTFKYRVELLEFLDRQFDIKIRNNALNSFSDKGDYLFSFAFQCVLLPKENLEIKTAFGYLLDEGFSVDVADNFSEQSDKQSYIYFSSPEMNKPLTRELLWHSYYLQAGCVYSKVYDRFFVDQGSAYGYLHGASGAPRDWAFFIIPLIYLNPQLAKEMLLFIAGLQSSKTGKFPYAIVGNGKPTGAGIHSFSSDLDLFFMWAVFEYLGATFDKGLLWEEVPFVDSKERKTFLDHIKMSFQHLKGKIGVGKHGLVRAGSGDWNDPLLAFSNNPIRTFLAGESSFNSLLALCVIPKLASILEEYDLEFAQALSKYAEEIKKNVSNTWNGKWFIRGFTGKGEESIGGLDKLFLDTQPFGILADIISEEEKKNLIESIKDLCVNRENFGARSLFPPMKGRFLEVGSDTNGGVWHAINAWLTWAWTKVDLETAWDFFQKTTLFTHAEVYPGIWYGIWSGPDAYNSSLSKNPGETFNLNFTPMTDFPIMNMNSHAGILFSIIKFLFEPNTNGLIISNLLPLKEFEFYSELIDLVKTEGKLKIGYRPRSEGVGKFIINLPSGFNYQPQLFLEDDKNILISRVLRDNSLTVELKLTPHCPLTMCIEW